MADVALIIPHEQQRKASLLGLDLYQTPVFSDITLRGLNGLFIHSWHEIGIRKQRLIGFGDYPLGVYQSG